VAGRTWEDTQLWQELASREDEPATKLKRLLAEVLPDIEEVLDSGGTIPLNFTLHDAEHSWRVAQWIVDLAGPEVLDEMEPYDLATLLLSAYLHDIGMSPDGGRVEAYVDFLISGERGAPDSDGYVLSETETAELQEWLDEAWDGLVPPIVEGRPSPADNNLARKIAAYYVRHRHNDWSEPWIAKHVAPKAGELYSDWVADLVLLCRSHHFGIRELKDEQFAPKRVDASETVLHLRYCACLLRMADVLDVDPERTPPILFEHRVITGESVTHWRKCLRLSSRRVENHIELKAEPENAIAHNALVGTVADINRELALCRQLDDETDFRLLAGEEKPLPHRWTLELGVRASISPYERTYEYVDGTFRPDPQRLLELLGGIELYGSPFAAVRELLQNAFDAVREQIARQRLRQSEAGSTETRDRIAAEHEVSLVLESDDSSVRLVCRDTGVGMSKDAITSRFLVGGTKPSPGLLRLERACAAEDFSVGRTARFGIGVLSYFLLAKRLVVRTLPSKESDDRDGPGWTFTSFGLADFGELKQTPHKESGTEVEFGIDPRMLSDNGEAFAAQVAKYVADTVRRAPCQFSFSAPDFGLEGFSSGPGWTDREGDARDALLRELSTTGRDIDLLDRYERLPIEQRKFRQQVDEDWRAVSADARQRLELIVEEGDLPDGLGAYRIFVGHFELDAGKSLAYLKLKRLRRNRYMIDDLGDPQGTQLPSSLKLSWNGMDVSAKWDASEDREYEAWDGRRDQDYNVEELLYPDDRSINSYIEVDWTSDKAGTLAVDRNYFTPEPVVMEALRYVDLRAAGLLADFADANSDSAFALLNAHLIDRYPENMKLPPFWARDEVAGPGEREYPIFAPLELPAICLADPPETIERPDFIWRGKVVARAGGLNIADRHERKRNHRAWFGDLFGPQYVGAIAGNDWLQPVLVWEKFEPNEMPSGDEFVYPAKRAQFPPEWKALARINSAGDQNLLSVWNRDNPLCKAVDPVSWEWALSTFAESAEPFAHEEEILLAPGRAAAWIMMCLYDVGGELWSGVAARSPEFLRKAWGLIPDLGDDDEILSVTQLNGQVEVRVLTSSEWQVETETDGSPLTRRLDTPSKDWFVTVKRGWRGGR
jgi:hypothetical protein